MLLSFFSLGSIAPQWALVSSFTKFVFLVDTTTHHNRQDSAGRVIRSSQRPLPDNTQHSQQTDIHVPGGIRTHDLSRRAAVDLSLRPRGHWDRHATLITDDKFISVHLNISKLPLRFMSKTVFHKIFRYFVKKIE